MSRVVGRGSGSVYLPGSKAPFNPINPYGRTMPNPTRPYREERHALYQVELEAKDGSLTRAGPKGPEEIAASLARQLNFAIGLGQIDHVSRAIGVRKEWSKAHVVLAKPPERRDTRTIREILLNGGLK